MYKFVLCIYLVEARWKWGVMGGSHGGETAALHPAPPSSSCPRSPYFVFCIIPYLHFVFVVFVFCVVYATIGFSVNIALSPSFLFLPFWPPLNLEVKSVYLVFTPEKPSLHTRQSVRTFAQTPPLWLASSRPDPQPFLPPCDRTAPDTFSPPFPPTSSTPILPCPLQSCDPPQHFWPRSSLVAFLSPLKAMAHSPSARDRAYNFLATTLDKFCCRCTGFLDRPLLKVLGMHRDITLVGWGLVVFKNCPLYCHLLTLKQL